MTTLSSHKCAICHEILGDDGKVIMTIDFFAPTDPLAEYADVTMHEKCFINWSKRNEFLLANDCIREHKQSLEGPEIIRLMRKHNSVIRWDIMQAFPMRDAERLKKEQEQQQLFANNEFTYLGNGPSATGPGPGWRLSSSLYLKCILCDYMMVMAPLGYDRCFCGALAEDADAGRIGSRLRDKRIEVYEALPKKLTSASAV